MTTLAESGELIPCSKSATYADWRSAVELELKGVPVEKKLVTRTPEGIDVMPLYRREDAPAAGASTAPGEPPFARGTRLPGEKKVRWEARTAATMSAGSPLPALAMAIATAKHDATAAVPADPLGWLLSHRVAERHKELFGVQAFGDSHLAFYGVLTEVVLIRSQ